MAGNTVGKSSRRWERPENLDVEIENVVDEEQVAIVAKPPSSSLNVADPSSAECAKTSSSSLKLSVAVVLALLVVDISIRTHRSRIIDTNTKKNIQAPRRSFVCITGQLGRLELENKIGSVLGPLRAAGYEPDVALIIDDSATAPHVTNNYKFGLDYSTTITSAFPSFQAAVSYLREDYGFQVLTDQPYEQVAEPILNEQYIAQLHHKKEMTDEDHLDRARNNIRMLETWAQCHAAMVADLERASTYEIVIRIREDVGFIEEMDVQAAVVDLKSKNGHTMKPPPTIISNGCRQNHGMNDKWAILSPDAAKVYFMAPFHHYYARPMDGRMQSTETETYFTYLQEGLRVLQGPRVRHVVKLVTDENGRTRLFPEEKSKLKKACNVEILHENRLNNCVLKPLVEGSRGVQGGDEIIVNKGRAKMCWAYKYGNFTDHCH